MPPKSEIENRSNRHLTQNRLQVTGCTADIYCLLHVVVQGPGSFRAQLRSTFLFDVRLRSCGTSKLPNFRILAYIPHTKPLNVPSGDQPTAQGLHRRIIPIFPRGSRRSKRVPSGRGVFFATSGRADGTPKLAQIFDYGKWLYTYRTQLHSASDLDQRCLKTRNSKDGCTFPPNIFAPTPKITSKPHFGVLSMQNLLYGELSVSRMLMELRR